MKKSIKYINISFWNIHSGALKNIRRADMLTGFKPKFYPSIIIWIYYRLFSIQNGIYLCLEPLMISAPIPNQITGNLIFGLLSGKFKHLQNIFNVGPPTDVRYFEDHLAFLVIRGLSYCKNYSNIGQFLVNYFDSFDLDLHPNNLFFPLKNVQNSLILKVFLCFYILAFTWI